MITNEEFISVLKDFDCDALKLKYRYFEQRLDALLRLVDKQHKILAENQELLERLNEKLKSEG